MLPFAARASDFSQTYYFNGPHTDGPLKQSFANGGINAWFIAWHAAGSPLSNCSIEVDSSSDGVNWGTGDVVPAQSCVTSGAAQGAFNSTYIRINVTALSGGGLTVLLNGYGGGNSVSTLAGSSCVNYESGPIPVYSHGLIGLLGRMLGACQTTNTTANLGNLALFAPENGVDQAMTVECSVTLTQPASNSSTLPQCVISYTDVTDTPQSITVTPAWASGTMGCTGSTTNSAGNSCKGSTSLIQPMLGTAVTYSTSGYTANGTSSMKYSVVALAKVD